MEIVTINRLGFRYQNCVSALSDVTLSVKAGEFLVICGRSGSGKTTLLRHLKPQLAPRGETEGEILFCGEPLSSLDERAAAARIGFVAQSPEGQIVTDKVWHELAFGLESLGLPTDVIRRRVAETASFFGIHNWFHKDVSELSGGQKQLLNLAAVMVMQPELLILDEPTSRLDPIAAAEFLAMLKKINDELGTTIILSEHRLEEALSLASRVVVMERGSIVCADSAAAVGKLLKESGSAMFCAMPAAARIWGALGAAGECPVSVKDGRAFLREFIAGREICDTAQNCNTSTGARWHISSGDAEFGGVIGNSAEIAAKTSSGISPNIGGESDSPLKNRSKLGEAAQKITASESTEKSGKLGEPAIGLRGVWFKYERTLPDVLRGCGISARFGEIVCVVGGNGAGKSTLLKALAGVKNPYRGTVMRNGKVCLLPQDARLLFSKKTVREELSDALSDSDDPERIAETAERCGISALLDRHPYDLSGGETQRAALAKLLLAEPRILLLDEPTQGLDAGAKAELCNLLKGLARGGACVVAVSHDIEFCAETADRCALFFDGAIAAEGSPREFFSDNNFYTTPLRRICRGIIEGAVTVEDAADLILGRLPKEPPAPPSPPASGNVPNLCDLPNAPENGSVSGGEAHELCKAPVSPSPPASGNVPNLCDLPKAPETRAAYTYYNIAWWRKLCAAGLVISVAAAWAIWGRSLDFSALLGSGGVTAAGWRTFALFGLGIVYLAAAALIVKGGKPLYAAERSQKPRRAAVAAIVQIAVVAGTVWLGVAVLPRRAYYLTATAIILECLAACFIGIERRGLSARRLAVIAALCALGIVGRAAFFMLPQVKPVLAIAILAGVGLGGEAGFTVGAVTMLVSNIMFGQGPWTPWQMFAAGACGLIGGLAGRTAAMRRRGSLAALGAALAVIVYGGIVNPSSAFIWGGESLSFGMIASYWLSGLPMDALHGLATAAFLWVLSEPLLGALARADADG